MKVTACKKISIAPLFFFLLFVYSSSAHAIEYYVSKSGNDSNPGTAALPWLTITKAASLAQAGDTINVGAGRYSDPTATSKRAFNPANSGTPGNPITFRSDPPLAAVLVSRSSDRSAIVIAPENRSYITIDGFKVKGRMGATSSNNIILENNEVIFGGSQSGSDKSLNWGMVLQTVNDSVVRNNYVHDLIGNGNYTHNTAGIMLILDNSQNLIEHNYVDAMANEGGGSGSVGEAVRSAYGQKGGNIMNNTWRRNVAINAPFGFLGIGSTDRSLNRFSEDNSFYENIIINAREAFNAHRDTRRWDIYNNTAYQVENFVFSGPATANGDSRVDNMNLWNNIIANSGNAYGLGPTDVDWELFLKDTDYNNFFEVDAIAAWKSLSLTYDTLPEWQSLFPGFDSNSFVADPMFVDAANGDFRLQVGSPSTGSGLGGVDRGAYPTGSGTVGPTNGLWPELLPVPEPTSAVLSFLAVIGLLARRRHPRLR